MLLLLFVLLLLFYVFSLSSLNCCCCFVLLLFVALPLGAALAKKLIEWGGDSPTARQFREQFSMSPTGYRRARQRSQEAM